MSIAIAVIYEAPSDLTTAAGLADRVLVEQIAWLDDALLDSQHQWFGEAPPAIALHGSLFRGARDLGIRVHGHFAGEPGLPDAAAARRAIAYVLRRLEHAEAIVLIRDADDQLERRQGLEQARAAAKPHPGCKIVIGVAIRERESWVVCGFQPRDAAERLRLQSEHQKLGWDPCLRPEELTAGEDKTALRSPKRVLGVLTDNDRQRQRECLQETSLEMLRTRGRHNGLAEYLAEVCTHIVPLIAGFAKPAS